jgi:predicted nucleic acid-binding protein
MYLIDTNVISELTRPKPDTKVVHFLEMIEKCPMSVITFSELSFGIGNLDKNKQKLLLHWMDGLYTVAQWYPVTEEIATHAGYLRAISQKKGVTLNLADGLIAATADSNDLILVTRNLKDFKGLKIRLLNPFS